jgi:hypothetical protein
MMFCSSLLLFVLYELIFVLCVFIYAYCCSTRFPYRMMFVLFKGNTPVSTSGGGTAHPSRVDEFTFTVFSGIYVAQSVFLCVVCYWPLLVFYWPLLVFYWPLLVFYWPLLVFYCHCVVCPSTILRSVLSFCLFSIARCIVCL